MSATTKAVQAESSNGFGLVLSGNSVRKDSVGLVDTIGKSVLDSAYLSIEQLVYKNLGVLVPKKDSKGIEQFNMSLHLPFLPGGVGGHACLWAETAEYSNFLNGKRRVDNLRTFVIFSNPFSRIDCKGDYITDVQLLKSASMDMLDFLLTDQEKKERDAGSGQLTRTNLLKRYNAKEHKDNVDWNLLGRIDGSSFWDSLFTSNTTQPNTAPGRHYATGVKKYFGGSNSAAYRLFSEAGALHSSLNPTPHRKGYKVKVYIPETFQDIINVLVPSN